MKLKISSARGTWMLLSSACGLALIVVLFLLVRLPAQAMPNADPTGAALTVTKHANKDIADPGDVLTYTISIDKLGADTTPAWLTDRLPSELEYVSGSLVAVDSFGDSIGTLGVDGSVITWHEPSLAGPVWITFSAEVAPGTDVDIVNVAEVTGTGQLITDSWKTRVGGGLVYFPLISKRWPPIPYAPTLEEIANPDQEQDYTVNWTYEYTDPPVTHYTLQEAKNADFTQDVNEFTEIASTSRSFADKDGGTYYYRVRGHNDDGPGPWSNVRSTTVELPFSYFDDFSDLGSGWPSLVDDQRWAFYEVDPNPPTPDDGSPYPRTGDGYFIARRSSSPPRAIFSPGVAVPSQNYEIEVDSRWWEGRWYATYQILFGADESLSNYYAVRVQMNDIGNFCRFSVVKTTPYATTLLNEGWTAPEAIHCGERRLDPATPWNHWRIRREDNWIEVHVNGTFLGMWKDSSFGANRYFGVRATLFEGFTPSKPEFDNFSVTLLD